MALHVPPTCPICDSTNVRKSHRRSFLEKLPILISLRPYRRIAFYAKHLPLTHYRCTHRGTGSDQWEFSTAGWICGLMIDETAAYFCLAPENRQFKVLFCFQSS